MSDEQQFEQRLRRAARALAYPPTPDLAGALARRAAARLARRRQLAGAALVLLALLVGALAAAPEARAALLRLLQIGVVRIIEVQPTPTPAAPAPATAAPLPDALRPSALALPDFGLAGATTFAEASASASFPIRLPSYPPDLGPPDLVFDQDLRGEALVFIWLDLRDRSRPRLSLHTLTSQVFVEKLLGAGEMELLAETEVGGAPALWVRGPHLVEVRRAGQSDYVLRRLVPGDTLIWTSAGLTYRLETTLPLDEAVRVAESLRPQ